MEIHYILKCVKQHVKKPGDYSHVMINVTLRDNVLGYLCIYFCAMSETERKCGERERERDIPAVVIPPSSTLLPSF